MPKIAEFFSRPLIGIALAIALAAGARAMSESAALTNVLLVIAAIIFAVEIYRAIPAGELRQIDIRRATGTALTAIVAVGVISVLWVHQPRITLYYSGGGSTLKGNITLKKACVPASTVQPYMCMDATPNSFDLFGITMVSNQSVEAQFAVLDFSNKVTMRTGFWQSGDTEGKHYGYPLNKETIPAGLPIAIPAFYGESSTLSSGITITLTVFYDGTNASTAFTIKPPD